MLRSRWRTILVCVGILVGCLGSVAVADSLREDWDCSGAPGEPCYFTVSGGRLLDSWGSVTAVNQADAYPKCAAISSESAGYGDFARTCGYGYTVRTQVDATGICPYPNNASGACSRASARVGNDTSVRHGLRGVGYR